MGIGIGIFLIAVGAILAFAVEADVAGISLWAVGWILMVVGLLGVIVGAVVRGRGRDAGVVEDRSVRREAG
jgi:uncharacterized membrane-anchored protein